MDRIHPNEEDEGPIEIALVGDLTDHEGELSDRCLLYTSPSPRDLSTSRMPSSA